MSGSQQTICLTAGGNGQREGATRARPLNPAPSKTVPLHLGTHWPSAPGQPPTSSSGKETYLPKQTEIAKLVSFNTASSTLPTLRNLSTDRFPHSNSLYGPALTFPLTSTHQSSIMSDNEDNEHKVPVSREESPIASPIDTPPAAADDDDANNGDGMSDHDSDQLSDVDVGDLEDYDPLKANIETRPVEIDEDIAKSLKTFKRKRAGGDASSKKPKEGRRQKKRRTGEGDDEVSAADGTIIEGKRRRPGAAQGGEKRSKPRSSAKATPEPENEDNLTPEQRRARAIEKAMDAAMKGKKSTRRSKKDDIVRCVSQSSSVLLSKTIY